VEEGGTGEEKAGRSPAKRKGEDNPKKGSERGKYQGRQGKQNRGKEAGSGREEGGGRGGGGARRGPTQGERAGRNAPRRGR